MFAMSQEFCLHFFSAFYRQHISLLGSRCHIGENGLVVEYNFSQPDHPGKDMNVSVLKKDVLLNFYLTLQGTKCREYLVPFKSVLPLLSSTVGKVGSFKTKQLIKCPPQKFP